MIFPARRAALAALTALAICLCGCAGMTPRSAAIKNSDDGGAFAENQRLLSTYFFFRGPWDDAEKTKCPWSFAFPDPKDKFAKVYGLDSPGRWPGNKTPDISAWPPIYKDEKNFPLWLMAEWRAMKWSGFDFALADVWASLDFNQDGTPQFCFQSLLDAWTELDKRGENPIPIGFFLETPFGPVFPDKDRDATRASSDGIDEIWIPVRYYLRQFYGEGEYAPRAPLRALARVMVDGEARPVLHFWFPTWGGAGLQKWDAWTFEELRRKCAETFGVEPYIGVNQHIYGPTCEGGWSSVQPGGGAVDISPATAAVDYDIPWWGSMAGAKIFAKAIVIGPGHWCMWQTADKPVALRYGAQYGQDKYRYLENWRTVFSDPRHFDRRLLVVESWNNDGEGCAISYSAPKEIRDGAGNLIDRWGDSPEQFMRWTRELAPYWKKGKPAPRFRDK